MRHTVSVLSVVVLLCAVVAVPAWCADEAAAAAPAPPQGLVVAAPPAAPQQVQMQYSGGYVRPQNMPGPPAMGPGMMMVPMQGAQPGMAPGMGMGIGSGYGGSMGMMMAPQGAMPYGAYMGQPMPMPQQPSPMYMLGQEPAITVAGGSVYIAQGGVLYKFDARTLELQAQKRYIAGLGRQRGGRAGAGPGAGMGGQGQRPIPVPRPEGRPPQ
jgi:hypothetical protein